MYFNFKISKIKYKYNTCFSVNVLPAVNNI